MASVERMPSEMADVPKRAVSKKAFFMRRTLVSTKRTRKEITLANAWVSADDVAAFHDMGDIFQYTDVVQRVAVHRNQIGKASQRDAAEIIVFVQ